LRRVLDAGAQRGLRQATTHKRFQLRQRMRERPQFHDRSHGFRGNK
jgi:hypothetical protein